MTPRGACAIALLALAALVAEPRSASADLRYQCPSTMHAGATRYRLFAFQLYEDPANPETMVPPVMTKLKDSRGKTSRLTWELNPERTEGTPTAICRYIGTTATVAGVLPPTITHCEAYLLSARESAPHVVQAAFCR